MDIYVVTVTIDNESGLFAAAFTTEAAARAHGQQLVDDVLTAVDDFEVEVASLHVEPPVPFDEWYATVNDVGELVWASRSTQRVYAPYRPSSEEILTVGTWYHYGAGASPELALEAAHTRRIASWVERGIL